MPADDVLELDLTGPASHRLPVPLQNATLTIGGRGSDLVVGPDERLRWHALDALDAVRIGGADQLDYTGSDTGLLDWARDHQQLPLPKGMGRIPTPHEITWVATADLDLDLAGLRIVDLTLVTGGHHVRVRVPEGAELLRLELHGDPADLDLEVAGRFPELSIGVLQPRSADDGTLALELPTWLDAVEHLYLEGAVMGPPIDAARLALLPRLRVLRLAGAVTRLDALNGLPLRSLELRFAPDLSSLPPLTAFPELDRVVVWNCDAEVTKRVRREIKAMPASEAHRSASQGRDARWFTTEHGLPFAAMPKRMASAATRAFKAAAKAVPAAPDADAALAAIGAFAAAGNDWEGVETEEREAMAEAAQLLAGMTEHVDADAAMERFDAARDY